MLSFGRHLPVILCVHLRLLFIGCDPGVLGDSWLRVSETTTNHTNQHECAPESGCHVASRTRFHGHSMRWFPDSWLLPALSNTLAAVLPISDL